MHINITVLKKTLLFLFGIFFTVYLLILLVFPNIADINKYRSFIESQVENTTGLKFSAENMELKTKFSPYINLYAYHVRFLYPDGTTCFKVTDANIKIRVLPLLFKKVEFKKIILTRPVLSFSISPDGATSLDKYILKMNESAKKSHYKAKNNIPEIILYNYKIKVKDSFYSSPFVLSGNQLRFSDILLGDSLRFMADGTLTYRDKKFIAYNLDVKTPVQVDKKQIFNVNPFQNIYKYNLCANVDANLKYDKKVKKSGITGNISIKDLSFVINNKSLAGNFINLDFSNNAVAISSKLKTNQNETAAIVGKYSYGMNKKLLLNVKADNSDLANLSELLTALFTSFNIKNKFSEYKISGFANFNFNIDTDFKKLRSGGIATLKNVSLKSQKYPFSISDVNSEISFKNDFINIISASASINNTPVKIKGDFDSDANIKVAISADNLSFDAVKNAFAPDEYKKNIDVSSGKLSFSSLISGRFSNLIIKTDATIKELSFKNLKEKIDVKAQSAKFVINSKSKKTDVVADLYNFYLYKSDFKFPATSPHISLISDGNNLDVKKSKIKWNYSDLFLSGGVKNIEKEPDAQFKLNGTIYAADLYNLIRLSSNMQASPKGKIPFVAELASKGGKNKLQAQFFPNSTNYLSYIVIKELLGQPSVLSIALENEGKIFKINDFSLYKSKGVSSYGNLISIPNFFSKIAGFWGEVDMSTNEPVIKGGKFIVPESLTASVIGFKNSEISIKSDITLNGKLSKPDITGNLYINNLSMPDYGLKVGAGSVIISKDKGTLYLPNISVGKSKLGVHSDILIPESSAFSLSNTKIAASYLDLEDLLNISAQFKEYLPGVKVPINIKNGTLSINHFKSEDIVASNVNSSISLHNNFLHLDKLTADAYNGRVSGDINSNLLSGLVTLNLKGASLDGAPVMAIISGKNDELSGKLDFYSNVSLSGSNRYEQIQSLKGNFNFAAYNGKLKTLGSFEHFLYAQNLISQSLMKASINLISKAVAPKNTGLFKSLHANITFYSGYANIKSLKFSGPNMSMYIDGKFNMLNNVASLNIMGKVSNEIVGVLGPFGDLSLSNLVNTSSSTPLPNIFFSRYNQKISQSEYAKIPPLVPETSLKTKPFSVNIIGPAENIKSVKSFKWLVVGDDSASGTSVQESSKTQEVPDYQAKKLQREYSNTQSSEELPSFLDKLPDEIKN